jgi:hypothetical protein
MQNINKISSYAFIYISILLLNYLFESLSLKLTLSLTSHLLTSFAKHVTAFCVITKETKTRFAIIFIIKSCHFFSPDVCQIFCFSPLELPVQQ